MIFGMSVWAVVLRNLLLGYRNINILLGNFYWPLLDVLVWGFLGAWIQNSQIAGFNNYEATALLGILLWQVVGRGSNILANALNEELWTHNIVTLFSLPLKMKEWICGITIFTLIMLGMTSAFCMIIMFAVYDISIGQFLWAYLMFAPPLVLSMLWLGFTCLQIVALLGKRGIELGYIVIWFLLPFSGAYYPIDVLPAWGKAISACLPMSYIFAGMRGYMMYQKDPTIGLIKGSVLGLLYAVFAIALFVYCFNRAKQKGLARLLD